MIEEQGSKLKSIKSVLEMVQIAVISYTAIRCHQARNLDLHTAWSIWLACDIFKGWNNHLWVHNKVTILFFYTFIGHHSTNKSLTLGIKASKRMSNGVKKLGLDNEVFKD